MSASVEKLKAARELITRPGGWVKGRYFDVSGLGDWYSPREFSGTCGVCMYGALAVALDTETFYQAEQSPEARLLESLVEGDDGGHCSLNEWQDDPKRKKHEVVAAFDRAIALAEAESSP